MNTKIRYGLSAAVLALIGAGASAPQILDQFLDEKEGNHTMAYRDGSADGKGEVADTLHQHGEQPFTALQGGVDRLGRHAVGGLCHGGQRGRVSGVHHRGNGKSGGLPSGGEAGRRHRSRHPAACRKAEKQGITKKQNVSTKKEKRV